MALVTVHSELRRNRDFAWRRPLHGRRRGGKGGHQAGEGGLGGKTDPMKTVARGAFELRRSLPRSARAAGCTSLPPTGRPARTLARALSQRPDESSTSWRKAGTQGLNSASRNYQDRDPPTQYSNLYTHLEAPALPLGKLPVGAGRGARKGRVGEGLLQAGCSVDWTCTLLGPPDRGKEKGDGVPVGWWSVGSLVG